MNIVEQAARMIDPEHFGPELFSDELYLTRRRYMQAKALNVAAQVLKLAVKTADLREQLIRAERDGWEKLGIPARELDKPEVMEIIKRKFA